MISAYITHLAVIICIFAILGVSLNLALGFTGLINLAHIAFYGVGAYVSALLALQGHSFLVSMLAAGVAASICGLILTFITNKLEGDYFALGTLGFSFVAYAVFLNWTEVTRGPLGIPGIPKPEILGLEIFTNQAYLVFSIIMLALVTLIVHRITRSRYGKLLGAVRDDALGLAVLGKNIFRLKLEAMAVSAFFAGIAGSMYAHYISYIDPSTFYLTDIVLVLTVVIIGGLASVRGSIVGAIVVLLLPEVLRFVDMPSAVLGASRQIFWSLLLILILLIRPRGIFGKVDLE